MGPWTDASNDYTQRLWLIVLSYALPVLGIAGALLVRWRARLYFIVLIVAGTLIAVGTHPYLHPALLGAAFKAVAGASSAGLALRNSPRAVPLLMLGIVACTAALLQALADRVRATPWIVHRPRAIPAAFAAVGVLAILNAPPLWMGRAVQPQLDRPCGLSAPTGRRRPRSRPSGDVDVLLEVPGMDFGTYRWGYHPGHAHARTDGPALGSGGAHPLGSPASVDLLRASSTVAFRKGRSSRRRSRPSPGSSVPARCRPASTRRTSATACRGRGALWEQLLDPPTGLTDERAYGDPVANRAVRRSR